MASGKSVSNIKWYVKNRATGAAECGPYPDAESAEAGLTRRKAKLGDSADLYTKEVDICKLAVHPQPVKAPRQTRPERS